MITLQEIKEKDLAILANLFPVINLDLKKEEAWTYSSSLSYLQYFYHHQPDLFLCAYDENIPIGAIMSIVKPYWDGLHLTQTELFVSEDYREQKIGTQLVKTHFELAISKYQATQIDTLAYTAPKNFPLILYEKIGLKAQDHFILLQGNLEDCVNHITKKERW